MILDIVTIYEIVEISINCWLYSRRYNYCTGEFGKALSMLLIYNKLVSWVYKQVAESKMLKIKEKFKFGAMSLA